jgi:hypothetical protein
MAVLLLGLFAACITAMLVGGAGAASPCANSLATANTLTTTSADGTTVHGSACSDRIVVTSPIVNEVVGGEGNDVIYANPNVEVVEAGAGDDVIYGDLPEAVVNGMAAPVYTPAPGSGSAARISIVEKKCEAGKSCYGGDGSQGDRQLGADKIFGQRGNDISGNAGNRLFGGGGRRVVDLGRRRRRPAQEGSAPTLNGESDTIQRRDHRHDRRHRVQRNGHALRDRGHARLSRRSPDLGLSDRQRQRSARKSAAGRSCESHQACNNEAI